MSKLYDDTRRTSYAGTGLKGEEKGINTKLKELVTFIEITKKLVTISLALLLFFPIIKFLSSSSNSSKDKKAFLDTRSSFGTGDRFFFQKWSQHITSHPIQSRDRLGFAEMALRCRTYVKLLQEHNTVPFFSSFERHLWPFIPGIQDLRQNALEDDRVKLFRGIRSSKAGGNKLGKANSFTSLGRKGIVMSLGRGEFRFAMHFLENLRNSHKSNLPVEIYYYGEDDLPRFMRTVLEQQYEKVRCIDLEDLGLFDPNLVQLEGQGWALKPFAMIATSFKEVILVDADAVFLTDPNNLFRVRGYQETGTLFFHDRDHTREGASKVVHDFMNEQLGSRGPSPSLKKREFWIKKGIYEQESGVVVLNKSIPEVFTALLFAAWQNTGGVREMTTYRVFWGDKESYWLSFELAGFPYYFVENYAGGLGRLNGTKEDTPLIQSEHPLHFIRYDHSSHSAEHEKTKKELNHVVSSLGQVAWFNGGLLQSKHNSEEEYLDITNWGISGQWHFDEKAELWALQTNFTGPLSQLGIQNTFQKLIKHARNVDRKLDTLLQNSFHLLK